MESERAISNYETDAVLLAEHVGLSYPVEPERCRCCSWPCLF